MTLFCTKYSSQVVLGLEPLQKSLQSAVVTVLLLTICTLAQVSKLRFDSVRFPRRQTLQREGPWFIFTALFGGSSGRIKVSQVVLMYHTCQ